MSKDMNGAMAPTPMDSVAAMAAPAADSSKTFYRTIFLSDIHLGTRGCQAEVLLSFLKRHRCRQLYLVGDIIDGWRMQSGIYWPQTHSNVLRRFLTLAKRGTRVVYVAGNHDEFLRRYAPMVFGNIDLVDEAEHLTAAGKRLLVVHGDQFDVVTRYHRWIAFIGDASYEFLIRLNRSMNLWRRKFGLGHWSLSAWIKYRVKRAVSFISEYEHSVAHECRRREFDGVVCGHIHHAEISDIQGVSYHNCGDWVESCTALVEHHDGRMEVVRWLPHATDAIGEDDEVEADVELEMQALGIADRAAPAVISERVPWRRGEASESRAA